VEVPEAGGAMYAFFRLDGFADSLDLAKRLVAEVGLGLAPGAAFGPEGDGWLRWCHAVSDPQKLLAGVDRLASFVARHRPGLTFARTAFSASRRGPSAQRQPALSECPAPAGAGGPAQVHIVVQIAEHEVPVQQVADLKVLHGTQARPDCRQCDIPRQAVQTPQEPCRLIR
jgi:hypothetical protein